MTICMWKWSRVFLTSFWDVVWIYGHYVNASRTPHTAAEAFIYVKISRYAYSKMKDPLPAYFAYIKYSRMLHMGNSLNIYGLSWILLVLYDINSNILLWIVVIYVYYYSIMLSSRMILLAFIYNVVQKGKCIGRWEKSYSQYKQEIGIFPNCWLCRNTIWEFVVEIPKG